MFETDFEDDEITSNKIYQKKTPLVTKKVTEGEINMRLDKFLVQSFPEFSRSRIIKFITTDCVKYNEKDEFADEPDLKVKEGDSFVITPPDAVPATPVAENIPLEILYEDEDVLVVNKPAGMVVHPGAGNYTGTLVNALLYHAKETLSGIGGVLRPGIVHRIDKDTSGILVVAKNDFAHTHLAKQFQEHTIERIYHAFVWNVVKEENGLVSGSIGRSKTNRQKMAIVKMGGKSAVTHYERLEVYPKIPASHIKCILETGRTHQIRVHMASKGHSLIGDYVYGVVPKQALMSVRIFPRQALHAGFLAFIHPKSGKRLAFEVDLPDDMKELKKHLQDK